MKIAVIGTGYVGLVSGTCFSHIGHTVVCVDTNDNKIDSLNRGIIPIFEPNLAEMVQKNSNEGRLLFSTDLAESVASADVVFIAVGTPTDHETGRADLRYVYEVADGISQHMNGYTVVVNKSTVPVGTGDAVERIISEKNPHQKFSVVSNPEFLREGAAIEDFMRPDRIIIGTDCERARGIIRNLYTPITDKGYPIHTTTRRSAEIIKYAANSFLAMKISFINEIADLCEKVDGDIDQVAKGLGSDSRIGDKFLRPGPGYGGSCFPKDTRALIKTSEEHGVPLELVQAAVNVNENRKLAMAQKITYAFNGNIKGSVIGVLGLSFKANTDDMRDSPSLIIIPELLRKGAKIRAFDPECMAGARDHFGDTICYCDSMEDVVANSDAIVILTEWDQFKQLGKQELNMAPQLKFVYDMRNILKEDTIRYLGSRYISLGRFRR